MGVTTLILCAGDKYQWETNAGIVQQLLPIDGTTVLKRMVSQVKEPIIVTCRDEIRNHVPDARHFEPKGHDSIADTWLNTRELWDEQTVILFGDVVYGKITIEQIPKYRGLMMAVGDSAEIYAFSFDSRSHERLAVVLGSVRRLWPGSAWMIYREWCGIARNQGRREHKVFRWVWDRCADIDSMREYRDAVAVWGK